MTDRSYVPALAIEPARTGLRTVAADFLALTKPRIGGFVFFSSLTGGLLAAGPSAPFPRSLEAALWITASAAAASVFNQVLERDLDRMMHRTVDRPLPSGRMKVRDAVLFGALLAGASTTALAVRFGLLAALLSLASLLLYALVYTPLKRVSTFNTVLGAVPGAAPPLLGYVALAGEPGPWAWSLYAVVFAWQFPHFMAIAWMHREDYARAGMRMLPALESSAGLAGRQALAYALVLLPVSLLPVMRAQAGVVYAVGALVLGLAYLAASAAFAQRESIVRAKAVLYVSLFYLPLLFSLVLLDPLVRTLPLLAESAAR